MTKAKPKIKARAVVKRKPLKNHGHANTCGHSTKSKGRPKILLNEEQVEKLAALGTPVKAGSQNTRNELRQNQLFVANEQLDSKMLIWLGKQLLGQRDKIESEVTHVGEISMLTQD